MAVGTAKREHLGGQLADWVTDWLFNYKSDYIIVLGDWDYTVTREGDCVVCWYGEKQSQAETNTLKPLQGFFILLTTLSYLDLSTPVYYCLCLADERLLEIVAELRPRIQVS